MKFQILSAIYFSDISDIGWSQNDFEHQLSNEKNFEKMLEISMIYRFGTNKSMIKPVVEWYAEQREEMEKNHRYIADKLTIFVGPFFENFENSSECHIWIFDNPMAQISLVFLLRYPMVRFVIQWWKINLDLIHINLHFDIKDYCNVICIMFTYKLFSFNEIKYFLTQF